MSRLFAFVAAGCLPVCSLVFTKQTTLRPNWLEPRRVGSWPVFDGEEEDWASSWDDSLNRVAEFSVEADDLPSGETEVAVLVGIDRNGAGEGLSNLDDSLAELESLTRIGLQLPVFARTVISGRYDEICLSQIREALASVGSPAHVTCVFDEELSPEQQRTLERDLNLPKKHRMTKKQRAMERQALERSLDYDKFGEKRRRRRASQELSRRVVVRDRTSVVLELFRQRARSREARLQVALAVTLYRTPRLGSGETARIGREADQLGSTREERRLTMEREQRSMVARAAKLRAKLEGIRDHRARTRQRRRRNGLPTIALVGYANAGKSSLLAALSGANAFIDDAPFATVDPLARRVDLSTDNCSGPVVLVTDTVGFVSKLPALLTAAFRATLEEVRAADVVVHVVDASATARLLKDRARIVDHELNAIGVSKYLPRLTFFNKVDAVRPNVTTAAAASISSKFNKLIAGSAKLNLGLDDLKRAIATALLESQRRAHIALKIPWDEPDSGALLADLNDKATITYQAYSPTHTTIHAFAPMDLAAKLAKYNAGSPPAVEFYSSPSDDIES